MANNYRSVTYGHTCSDDVSIIDEILSLCAEVTIGLQWNTSIILKNAPHYGTLSRLPGKRGRPRKERVPKANTTIMGKILEAVNNHTGKPILYASTTKGAMKLVFDGHHFRYSYRKGRYTIFQCCYNENKEDCLVRVVSDQKLVYPLDGEHIHFVQATDKSVTSVKFAPISSGLEQESVTITDIQDLESVQSNKEQHTVSILTESRHGEVSDTTEIRPRVVNPETTERKSQHKQQVPVNTAEFIPRPMETNVKIENTPSQESLEYTAELASEKSASNSDVISSEEFREKIKKRLQKALLGKKK